MNKVDTKYNKVFYATGPECFNNIANDKFENIHKMLFYDALKKYFEDTKDNKYPNMTFDDFINKNNIIELRNQIYYLPSHIVINKKTFPYKQEKVDLSDWWNAYELIETNKDISDLVEDEEMLIDAKLVYIDYVRNRCKFRSKTTNKEFWTTLDYINKDTAVDKDEMTLKNTFAEMIKNI